MAFVDGRILWDPALPELEIADRRPIYDAMNDGLARLHPIPTSPPLAFPTTASWEQFHPPVPTLEGPVPG